MNLQHNLPRHHCYGSTGAACFEIVEVDKVLRVNIDLAKIENGKGQRNVAWNKKINFLLTDQELPILMALLLGYAQSISFSRSEKSMAMVRQAPSAVGKHGGIFIKGFSEGKHVSLPIGPGDSFWISTLVLNFLVASTNSSADTVIAGIRSIYKLIGVPKDSLNNGQ